MKKYNYNKASTKRIPKDLFLERAKLMYEYKEKEGFTLERIGIIFGLTKERVRQTIEKYEDNQKQLTLRT
jgi:hypothetical protein